MLLLGLDFETTGLDFQTDRITEIGAVLWDTDQRQPVQIFSALVAHDDAPVITPEIAQLTGITESMLRLHGRSPYEAFRDLIALINECEFIVAHNGAGFDRPMLEAQMRRYDEDESFHHVAETYPWTTPWIDTCMDIEFPPHITTRKLVHLAAEHGFLNPFAHRAIFDVLTMLRILDAYPLQPILECAMQPIVTLQALVSFDDRELAKARGYRWSANQKAWLKKVKAHKVKQEEAE